MADHSRKDFPRSASMPNNISEASLSSDTLAFNRRRTEPILPSIEVGWHRDEALRFARSRTGLIPTFDPFVVGDVVHRGSSIKEGGLRRLVSQARQRAETADAFPFWPAAGVSFVMGVLSIVPYNIILGNDRGSPLFIGFATNTCFVVVNLPNLRSLLFFHKIPKSYHAACVVLGFLFTFLKSDASARLPLSLSAVLQNLQMLVSIVVTWVLGSKYSSYQLAACALVTFGVGAAGQAAAVQSTSNESTTNTLLLGGLEMIGALVALVVLSVVVKKAFEDFGEHKDEQMVVQNLFSLPMLLLSWENIGPRLGTWFTNLLSGDVWMFSLLVCNIALTFGNKKAALYMMGRAPNLAIVQLVETVQKFSALVLTAFMNAPPLPSLGFWLGAFFLVVGTISFVAAPDAKEKVRTE